MLNGQPPPRPPLQRGLDALTHRGPDAEGWHFEETVALGHRRLSIIDLAGGGQPMREPAAGLTVAFNGEIYNYQELRAALEKEAGSVFTTQSDTEVLLHGYRVWGLDLLSRLVGMFAFALWDRPKRRLLLAVDHLGQKPLCYQHLPGEAFWFASEQKALLAARPGGKLDPQSLILYLMMNFVPQPRSMLAGARRLPAGHYLLIDSQQPDFEPKPYWRLPDAPAPQEAIHDEAQAKIEIEKQLRQSVRLCLRSDVPLGCFLSAGLDSAAVAAVAAQESGQKLRVFTAGFEGLPDERPVARIVAKHLSAEQIELSLAPRLENELDKFAWMLDEPIGDTSILPTYFICQAARQHTTVCLGGDGGDELFAGYGSYREHFHAQAGGSWKSWATQALRGAWDGLPAWARAATAPLATQFRPMVRQNEVAAIQNPLRRHLYFVTHHYPDGLGSWLRPDWQPQLKVWDEFGAGWPVETLLDTAARFDLSVNLPGMLLRKIDLASMAVSLEVRSPLLDHRLVAYSRSLAWPLKTNGQQEKLIFREVIRPWLPPELFNQPKRGFGAPMEQWLRTLAMEAIVRERLLGSAGAVSGQIIRAERLKRLVDDFYLWRVPCAQKIWTLFVLEQWMRRYHISL